MRAATLVLAFLALAGCRSSRTRPDRDYTSVNRESVHFLFDTFRDGNKVRKKSLRQDLDFKSRAPQTKMIRRTSIQFAYQSFMDEEWDGLPQILNVPKVESVPWKERLQSMRFGFLDSGD